MGGGLGLTLDLAGVAVDGDLPDDRILFSESAGRFLVTVDPARQAAFEALFEGLALARIGSVTAAPELIVNGREGGELLKLDLEALTQAWEQTYGEMI